MFDASGDRQLWVVRHGNGHIPVYAVPGLDHQEKEIFQVKTAIPLEEVQAIWLSQHLDPIAFDVKKTHWKLYKNVLEANLHKAEGITPIWYFKWGKRKIHRPTFNEEEVQEDEELDIFKNQMSSNLNEFVLYVCKCSGLGSLADCRLMWYRFCRCAVNWMLVKQKPLDMLFGLMRVVPYRNNWKAVITAKFPDVGASAVKCDHRELVEYLNVKGVEDELLNPENAAIPEEGLFSWSIEFEARNLFHDHAEKIEKIALKRDGPPAYYQRWVKQVKDRYDSIVTLLHTYWVENHWPMGDVDKALPSDHQFLRWKIKKGRVKPVIPEHPSAYPCTDDQPDDIDEELQDRIIAEEAFSLSPMPNEDTPVDVRTAG